MVAYTLCKYVRFKKKFRVLYCRKLTNVFKASIFCKRKFVKIKLGLRQWHYSKTYKLEYVQIRLIRFNRHNYKDLILYTSSLQYYLVLFV